MTLSGYKAMPVEDLIEWLEKIPKGTPVVYQAKSDHQPLIIAELEYSKAEDRKYFIHNDGLLQWYPHYDKDPVWKARYKEPQFVSVIILPGN